MASNAAEVLIDHALALRWSGLDGATQAAALAFCRDTLAVGVAGSRAAHADGVLAMARGWGDGGTAGALGHPGLHLPASSAAFVNAFQIHGQEFDCVHEPAVLHPLATVLSALLAEMDRGPAVSGAAFLAAMVAGVDVAVSLGLGAPGSLRFFRPATAGIFGSVAAIVALRQSPREEALDAFGHALALVSGTMQAHVEGKPALPLQVAQAARSALVAIDLAQAGMPGVRHPIDGPFGYFALLEQGEALAPVLAKLGCPHHITGLSWKPFPTGRAGHGSIVAVQTMLARGLRPETLARLEYHAPPLIHRLVGRAAHRGMAPAHARLCLPYLAAVTLLRGTVGLEDFGADRLADPQAIALASKISVIADGNPDPAAFVPARAVAVLTDGTKLSESVEAQWGAPAWPLSEADQAAKGRACLGFAGLGEQWEALTQAVAALPDTPDSAACLRASGLLG